MNKSEVDALEKRISEEYRKKLEAIRLVQRMLNEEAAEQHPFVLEVKPTFEPKQVKAVPISVGASQDYGEELEDSLIGTIQTMIQSSANTIWTAPKVEQSLRESHIPLNAKRPKSSILVILGKLQARGIIRLVKKGSGRIPNRYKAVVEPKKEEAANEI
jgi:hypothetical protein